MAFKNTKPYTARLGMGGVTVGVRSWGRFASVKECGYPSNI